MSDHLQIQLAYNQIGLDSSGIPYTFADDGAKALQKHSIMATTHKKQFKNEITNYNCHVWKLMEALWGDVIELEIENPEDHLTITVRRECVASWMEEFMSDVLENQKSVSFWDYITAHKLEEASAVCRNENKLMLGIMVNQLELSSKSGSYTQSQINGWKQSGADKFIDLDQLKVGLLGSGQPWYNSTHLDKVINVCENLKWYQAFALHLW